MPSSRDGAWSDAIIAYKSISDETVAALRSGDPARIRGLDDREIVRICAFTLTALGEAAYLLDRIHGEGLSTRLADGTTS